MLWTNITTFFKGIGTLRWIGMVSSVFSVITIMVGFKCYQMGSEYAHYQLQSTVIKQLSGQLQVEQGRTQGAILWASELSKYIQTLENRKQNDVQKAKELAKPSDSPSCDLSSSELHFYQELAKGPGDRIRSK